MNDLILAEYNGIQCQFNENGWFNATEVAERFGKRPAHWLELESTVEYVGHICDVLNIGKSDIIKTRRGKSGGTWLHPKLAVHFARWLDSRFAVWCDNQIDQLLRGSHSRQDWFRLRHEAASSFKVMNSILDHTRNSQGKKTASYHYMNEARMINQVLTGEYKSLDRSGLNGDELTLLASLEVKNASLIGTGAEYKQRKQALQKYAQEITAKLLT